MRQSDFQSSYGSPVLVDKTSMLPQITKCLKGWIGFLKHHLVKLSKNLTKHFPNITQEVVFGFSILPEIGKT